MPLPAKLKYSVDLTPAVLSEIELQLEVRGTVCEMPKCSRPAVAPYFNERSVLFVCATDSSRLENAPSRGRAALDKGISEAAYLGMLRKSFVFANNASGFALEESVEKLAQQIAGMEAREGAVRRERSKAIRRHQNKQAESIGLPDDEFIAARDLNELRRRRGETPLGRPSRSTVEPVRTQHIADSIQAPVVFTDNAAVSLPFPPTLIL